MGIAAGLLAWTVTRDHALGGLLALFAVSGLALLTAALAGAHSHLLGACLVLLGVPAAIGAAGASPGAAAAVGVALVALLELARWSAERRVHAPGRAPERRRWLHLAVVLGAGWVAGVAVVGLASGRVELAGWEAATGATAALVVVAAVAVTARWRSRAG